MGNPKIWLLLLLSTNVFAQKGSENADEQMSSCPLSARFKTLKKYVYQYTTESKNGVTGPSKLRNGPKVTCQVELEVPQECSFVLHTANCALSEVSVIDPQGEPVYRQAAGADAFQAAMEKNPLKITWEPVVGIRLYPEPDEPVNILNIKRGIISALNVPVMEESNNIMNTVHGLCKTDYTVNSRKDIDTDVTLTRDLSQCDQFRRMKLPSSPLALLPSLHGPLSKLISSTQDCNYQFDNRRKHMTNAVCTEKHIFLPFSHENSGISSVVTQSLTLKDSAKINNRVVEVETSRIQPLRMEYPEDKAPTQTKEAVLSTLRDLSGLSSTDQGQRRPGLFQKLVSELRALRNETLSPAVEEMMVEGGMLTWQALAQCGTPECTSAILQVIRTMDSNAVEWDAFVYALSLQSSPDSHRVRDMLSVAQHRQSKAIMYALANTVRKFHPGHPTAEVKDVKEFMDTMLGDCSGNEDMTFLTLRVVGVMGKAMKSTGDVGLGLKKSLMNCVQKGASLSVQKAAIQAFRLMDIDQEVRESLLEVYQDAENPVQKRVAAYLMLMKSPDDALLSKVITTLNDEQDPQVRSFVASHLDNIQHSDDPKTQQIRQYIEEALQDHQHPANPFTTMSRNYKMDTAMGSMKGNMIFDSTDSLPKEVLLETTLKAFGYNSDMLEVGIEGNGFEARLEALFGEQGFFPDSVSKAMYWAGHKMPDSVKQVLENWIPPLRSDRRKRQVPQDLMRDIGQNFQKLVRELRSQDSPEAMAYLRILENEVGYIKSSEMEHMAQSLAMYSEVFFKIMPLKVMQSLMSSTDNELYAHYIFLDESFSLPSASGLPLKFSLSGVFAPGAKGGLSFSPGMQQLSFMPSVGVEFITQMGIQIPEFVVAGIEMHTNMYHESSLNAKVTISRNEIKLSIPAPKGTTQLFSVSNKLMSLSSTQTKMVPSIGEGMTDSTECQPLFTGMNICTTLRYTNASSTDDAPYYPLTGESRLAVEIQPTEEVTEYTAAITSETLREGKEGRQKVDSLKLTLRASGSEPTEATATLKYNRNKNILTTEVHVPDYDIEAGIKLAVTDSNVNGKKIRGITLDVTNHNIPQLSLVGRARLESMENGMLQVQMTVPALSSDASATATLKNTDGLVMQLETAVNIPETSSMQTVIVRYDDNKFEVEMKSDLNSEIPKLIPNTEDYQRELQKLIDDILDQKVAKTDMKVRHIVTKAIEACNIWLDKVAGRNKRILAELTLPTVPEKLFLQSDSLFRYEFNQNKMAISLVLPLGGKSSEELNIPATLSIPAIDVPEIGWMVPANEIQIPTFTIPRSFDIVLPLLGLAEVTSKVNSNFYNWEGSISGGNNTVDVPSYIVHFKVKAQSPVSPLAYRLEGTGMISGTVEDNLKYLVNGSLSHSFIDASFSVFETLSVTDKLTAKANYKIEASSPLGLQTSLYYSAMSESTSEEVTGDGSLDGTIRVGSWKADSTYRHNYAIRSLDREGRGESNLRVNSPLIQAQNMIKGVYANDELSIVSKTNVQDDALKHVAELKYKDGQLSLKCDAVSNALGNILKNKVELGISREVIILRVESQADDATNQAYSLLTGSLNMDGLEVNSEGSLTVKGGRGLHKATVSVNRNGLVTSGTNSLQCSPLTFENIYNGGIDSSGAFLTSTTKGMAEDSRAELSFEGRISSTEASLGSAFRGNAYDSNARSTTNLVLNRQGLIFSNNMKGSLQNMKTENTHSLTLTLWTLAFRSKTDNSICEDASYKHDIKVDVKPFVTSIDMKNYLKLFDVRMNNEGQLKMEPTKLDLSGSLRGAYRDEHELRHTYELNYADLSGALKCSTTGKIMDAQMSHNCEIEIAGLTSKSNCEARINSESLRFVSTIRTLALPFSVTVNAIINSDGEVDLFGKHTGQLYSKLLVKAEPLALAYSHDCRATTTHMLESWESAAHLDNKFDGLLTPSEQSLTWKTKSKFDNHAYNQDVSTYNNAQMLGIEFEGIISTNLLNEAGVCGDQRSEKENQEFSVSGFLKYDKNSNSHIIELPFIKSLPAAFDLLKTAVVSALDAMQHYIISLDINQLIGELRVHLDNLPQQVSDFMTEIDLENKVTDVKEKLIILTQEYVVTLEDLEASVENLKLNIEKTLFDIATKIRDLIVTVRGSIERGDLSDAISNVLSQIRNMLKDVDYHFNIRETIVIVIDAIEDVIRQIDLQKLGDSSVAWLGDIDSRFRIKEKLQDKISELKQVIETFDVTMFFQNLRDYTLSINFDFAKYVEQLTAKIPTEQMSRVLESIKDVIVNWIEEYEIADKINAMYSYIRDLLLRYEFDKRFEIFMDQTVVLIKEFRIQETVQSLVDALKSIDVEVMYDNVMQLLDGSVNQFKSIDFKQSIDELKEYICSVIKIIKEFDYNVFVDNANQKISELTSYVNNQIEAYGIAQKIEASREFVRKIQGSIFKYLEQLKETRIAEVVKMMKDVIDTTAFNDIKTIVQQALQDMRDRVDGMNIREEILIYLQRASDSYTNMVAYISVQFNKLIEEIRKVAEDQDILNQISQAVDGILDALKTADVEIPSFVVPLTDLVIPAIQINLNRLQDISIPAQISVPEFTILSSYTVPAMNIDFEEIKQQIIAFIDQVREYEVPMPPLEAIFGDLRALYLSDLPDLTFPEITILEIKLPAINLPKLNLENFEITMLPIPELKFPQVHSEVQIPAFGKLYGEFRVNSPHYTLVTVASLENSTTINLNRDATETSKFTATLTSQAKSACEFLDYSLDATARLEASQMETLVFTETVNVTHMVFSIDHEGSLTFSAPSAEATAKTTAKATTEMYTADLVNNIALSLKSGISASIDTTYSHNLNIPAVETSSQATMTQTAAASLESGIISVTVRNEGSGKWSIQDYSDEGTHKNNLEFNINVITAKLTFVGETESKVLKMKQTVNAESVIFSHFTVDARAETELPFVKSSIVVLNGDAHVGDLKIALTASHNAELMGRMSGTISNTLEFLARPFEIVLDCKNEGNSKVIFPLKLTGKFDLQNEFGVILNSEMQRACWAGLARFNQYKYYHNFTMDNNQKDIGIYAAMNGEANVDFLTVPLTIPEMTVPYLRLKTPHIQELSLWDHAGLKELLTTPRQSFEMNLKLQYQKNPDMHTIDYDLQPFYNAISNLEIFRAHFELGRNKLVNLLTTSYNEAKTHFDKYKIDTSNQPPRFVTVPGYKIPILHIEVSSFRAELPAFGFFIPKEVSTPGFKVPTMGFSVPSYTLVLPSLELPVLHIPETLSELTLPSFTLPAIQNNIMIPAMGNMTCDFSFKSTVITLTANVGLYNQSDIVARFGASSTSMFDILKGKLDGSTSLTRSRGLKLATALSWEHKNIEGSHDCTVSLSKRNMEAILATVARVNLPFVSLEMSQELLGNTKTKPNVASKIKIKYMLNMPLIEAVGKGNIDQNLALEGLTSYVSLETSTKGKTDITVKRMVYYGAIDNEANIYLNANGLRSTVKTDLDSNLVHDKVTILNLNINNNLALEAFLRRVYATLNYTCNNMVNIVWAGFDTNGKHSVKANLDFVPLTTVTAKVDIGATQPFNYMDLPGDAGVDQKCYLSITADKQTFSWSGREQLASVVHSCDLLLSNDEAEVKIDISESVEGSLAFLKSVWLPVYQKTIWDVLKLEQVSRMDEMQFLNLSTTVVYTKNKEGLIFTLPSKLFENGVTFNIPELTLAVPSWVKEIPKAVRTIDMRFQNIDLPDQVSVPPVIDVPAFDVPFTTLHVPAFSIDLKNVEIPTMISTTGFDIMLPGLPKVEIPSFDIDIELLQNRMSFLSVKLPQYEIIISSFTFSKSITIGEHTINLDEIASQISNFEMPTITIPEQKIEIPEISLNLPVSVFIPAFGALSTTVKVLSPIYNVTSTANLENKESNVVTSLKSICTSTMIFLEYDLDATATLRFENGAVRMNGKCNLVHSDINVNWQHVFSQNLRMKRQVSPDAIVSRHTLNVDITSPTFVDLSFRYASRKDGITTSMASPSIGFLGLLFTWRSPSQVYGKVFSRYLSSPDKDTDIVSVKATLKNSEKLSFQVAWNMNTMHYTIEGLKERMPAITDALLKFINKYHTAHFGFSVNRASIKLKNSVSNIIERAYHEVPLGFDTLQNSMREMFRNAADSIPSIDITELLNSVLTFFRETNFALPGIEERLSGQELYERASRSASATIDWAAQRFSNLMEIITDIIESLIKGVQFTIPGSNVVVNGNKIVANLRSAMSAIQDEMTKVVRHLEDVSLEELIQEVHNLLQLCFQRAAEFIASLKTQDLKKMLRSLERDMYVTKSKAGEYKDAAKIKIQEIYNGVTVDRVNNDLKELVDFFQSHFYGGLNELIHLMEQASQSTAPYIRVTLKKMDIDVPLPFFWKSFSEWPTQIRQ
ncbi:apolipoprotein B-100 isoform X1 [Oncorhynchus masou masou]|uniref:apolipoprotein B-100 isoform X1 n=1 Tax=Oncorhynchus masou masou TaxID=90313 RepID=UPI003183C27B